MLSHDYIWNEEKKNKTKNRMDSSWKNWPVVEQYNREAGLSVCFHISFIGSAGGYPNLDSFIRSLACSLIN